jgi:hypothetical protein
VEGVLCDSDVDWTVVRPAGRLDVGCVYSCQVSDRTLGALFTSLVRGGERLERDVGRVPGEFQDRIAEEQILVRPAGGKRWCGTRRPLARE